MVKLTKRDVREQLFQMGYHVPALKNIVICRDCLSGAITSVNYYPHKFKDISDIDLSKVLFFCVDHHGVLSEESRFVESF